MKLVCDRKRRKAVGGILFRFPTADVRKLLRKFWRYCAVGVTAFAFDYALMVVFAEVVGIDPLVAAISSFCIATLFNYFASMRFVFTRRADICRKTEFFVFFLVAIIGLGLNYLLLWFGIDYLMIDYRIVKLVSGAIVGILSFTARRMLLDADRKRRKRDSQPN